MTDVAQLQSTLAVKKYQGLTLEPPTKDIIEIGSDCDAVTKEEEWVKKKKTELTTTKQIETRVKRQVVLEDGKVVEDSGPIVSTNTTEDTEKQESETNERRNLGDQDQVDGPNSKAIEDNKSNGLTFGTSKQTIVTKRPDGLVREVKEKKVVSREEIDELLETEDVKYLGDFSDETYVKAVNSGADNIKSLLLSSDAQKQLIPIGPRIVNQTSKSKKTIDTEDTDLKCSAQPDGTLVTEKKQTTEHEVLIDEDLPEADDNSTGSREKVEIKESSQRFHKQRDEQNVEFVANGKVIGKEMRYAAETETMERDGPPENPSDWDSLSDRVRKARRAQKTLLQQQKAAEAILGERKDALTKRPLDFDKEEETRKTETSKWLESHFGSESRSSKDSRDDDVIEPTKKTYFNVTIKSSTNVTPATTPTRPNASPNILNEYPTKLSSPSKVFVPEREKPKATFFQGVSDWSERKESTPKSFPSKSFQEELKNTLEKKHRLIKQSAVAASREDLRHSRPVKETVVKREEVKFQKSPSNGYKPTFRRDSREDSDDSRNIRIIKEDPGYISGSKNDLRFRKDSREELDRLPKNKRENGYLHREDSGYVKDSREDLRYIRNGREDSFIREPVEMDRTRDEGRIRQNSIQRDDSAYVSSSTYLTSPRSPKTTQRSAPIRTPDSGIRIRSPTPDDNLDDSRPTVPQRKRALERKLNHTENGYIISQMREEPPPDYSPPPRSRSISPLQQHHEQQKIQQRQLQNGSAKKQFQKTRFESETRPAATQTSPQKPNKVGSVIGNSIRKLVGKIRSASAERKLKIKTKRSPSPHKNNNNNNYNNNNSNNNNHINNQSQINGSSTYQQYNVIDGHIGQQQIQQQQNQQQQQPQQQQHIGIATRETSVSSSSGRRERTLDRRGSSDIDMASPKQRYYLGEDPYGGSIFGKENKYDGVRTQRINSRRHKTDEQQEIYSPSRATLLSSSHHQTQQQQPQQINSSTLGRFSKSTNRLTAQSNDSDMYRSVQTLPRKLDHKKPSAHSSTINVSIVNTVQSNGSSNGNGNGNGHITGPAKPARTYKSLNRSKSFNVHGLNGTANPNPSPIYMSKLTRNYSNSAYKSNPHLNESAQQLKSPSIVNLVSRSQRDLTKIDNGFIGGGGERRYNGINNTNYTNGNGLSPDKRTMFLKGLHDQAPELYKTLHGEDELMKNGYATTAYKYSLDRNGNNNINHRERESSLGSRCSPITINKDTASIIRRGSSSTDDYNESYKITTKSDDPNRPSITNTVQSFTKKTIPSKDGRAKETIESSETKTVTTSRYRGEPMSNLRYKEIERGRRNDGGPVVIELRNNLRRN